MSRWSSLASLEEAEQNIQVAGHLPGSCFFFLLAQPMMKSGRFEASIIYIIKILINFIIHKIYKLLTHKSIVLILSGYWRLFKLSFFVIFSELFGRSCWCVTSIELSHSEIKILLLLLFSSFDRLFKVEWFKSKYLYTRILLLMAEIE